MPTGAPPGAALQAAREEVARRVARGRAFGQRDAAAAVDDVGELVQLVVAAVGDDVAAGEQEVEHRAQPPHVERGPQRRAQPGNAVVVCAAVAAAVVARAAREVAEALRRHERGRAGDADAAAQLAVAHGRDLGERDRLAPVKQPQPLVLRNPQVVGLDVAVHDPPCVQERERARQLVRHVAGGVLGVGLGVREAVLPQGRARPGHDDGDAAALVGGELVGDEALVAELLQDADLRLDLGMGGGGWEGVGGVGGVVVAGESAGL